MMYSTLLITASVGLAVGASRYIVRRRQKSYNQHIAEQARLLDEECQQAHAAVEFNPPRSSSLDLPDCVRRFLDRNFTKGPVARKVTLIQEMYLRFNKDSKWMGPMPATQALCPHHPAFLFSSTAKMAPLMWARGYERLLGGKGRLQWRMWGLIPVSDVSDNPLLDAAGRTRWLSECMSYPPALAPSEYVRWSAVEGRADQAVATVDYQGAPVRGTFTFDANHNCVGFRSENYSRATSAGVVQQCPMLGHCANHTTFELSDGTSITIPTESEACFVEPDGEEWPYVRVKVVGVHVE